MINFEKENVESLFKETYNRVRNLKKKTKEMVAIGVTVFMLGSFIIYDAATGVAYASGSREGTPHAIMAGDQEIAVVQSRNDAEIVVANLQETYGKNDSTTTAMITPAISIEEKEYVTAESVKIVNAQEATYSIIERNDSEEPLFEVAIKQPLVQNQVIAHDTKVVEKSDLEKGKTEIKTEGVNGAKIVLGEQSLVNGKVVSSKIYSEEVTAEPVTAVVYKGTKEKVEVQPVRSSNRSSNRSSSR